MMAHSFRQLTLGLIAGLVAITAAGARADPTAMPASRQPRRHGDVNGDGRVDVQDAIDIVRLVALGKPVPKDVLRYGDVWPNPGSGPDGLGDGRLDLNDARQILAYALGLIDDFQFLPPAQVSTLVGPIESGPPPQAGFNSAHSPVCAIYQVASDSHGQPFFPDQAEGRVWEVQADGVLRSVAGDGIPGYRDGEADTSRFRYAIGVAVDSKGDLYIGDTGNHLVRRISLDRQVTTLAGAPEAGFADGGPSQARFRSPVGMDVDPYGNLYVADQANCAIRRIDPAGNVATIAGGNHLDPNLRNRLGLRNGPGQDALFRYPTSVALDAQGDAYVADCGNNCIRKISPDGWVSTVAGDPRFDSRGVPQGGYLDGPAVSAQFDHPYQVSVDATGNVFIADWYNQRIRVLTPKGWVFTVAGSDGPIGGIDARPGGYRNGPANLAEFLSPMGVAVAPNGDLFVADSDSRSLRLVHKVW